MQVKIQFEAQLPVLFKKKNKYVVACCPILDVISQGKNKEEAKRKLGDALSLFFISCYEHGTLEQVLKECGFSTLPITPQETISDQELIGVQVPFFRPENNPIECHA